MNAKAQKTPKPPKPANSTNLVAVKKPVAKVVETYPTEITLKKGESPILRFSTTAWLKIMHCRDCYDEEIAAYAISAVDDLLYVDDIWIPKQSVSAGSFEFDTEHTMEALEHLFSEFGIQPYQCSRIWIHTHPSGVLSPSGTDENTFSDIFGDFTWSIMVIFPKACSTPYAALKINKEGVPVFRIKIPVEPDYTNPNPKIDLSELRNTIQNNVSVESYTYTAYGNGSYSGSRFAAGSHNSAYGGYGKTFGYDDWHKHGLGDDTVDVVDKIQASTKASFETTPGIDEPEIITEEDFSWSGDCMICHSPNQAVNVNNVCIDCASEHLGQEILHIGDCDWCGLRNILVNDDEICDSCMAEFGYDVEKEKS